MKTKSIVLYSKKFNGYIRLKEQRSDETITALIIEFTPDIYSATTFENEEAKNHFIDNHAIGINYNFKTEYLITNL